MRPTNPGTPGPADRSEAANCPAQCFRINTPLVASQAIDGETVMIHFETGCYYSSDNLGAEIIGLLGDKKSVRRIANELASRYAGAPELIENAVVQFVGRLEEEQLIVELSATTEDGSGQTPVLEESAPPSGQLTFEPPVLQKYTDLEDLLMLDPIHETDEVGWPVAKRDTADAES